MYIVNMLGWRTPNQHPSESCLPDHIYSSPNFKSISLVKLIKSLGYGLKESKTMIDGIMAGQEYNLEFEDKAAALEFVRKANLYGAEAEIEND